MPADLRLSRGDMTALTGVDNDVLTFWIRKGLLHAEGIGQGAGRRISFAQVEASLAAIMLQLRNFGSNIETLIAISGLYRDAITWAEENGVLDRNMHLLPLFQHLMQFVESSSGEGAKVDFATAFKGRRAQTEQEKRSARLARSLKISDFRKHFWLVEELVTKKRKTSLGSRFRFFWNSPGGWATTKGTFFLDSAHKDGVLALVAVDVDTIVRDVWNKSRNFSNQQDLI